MGPHVVGQRVVVRRVVPGETGPSGGPALTDVLGVCESWADGMVSVRRESGDLVTFPVALVVSGKPVPPRPSARLRIGAHEIHLRAMEGLRSRHVEPLGDWVLRATGGSTGRTNSVLATVDPGIDLDDAVAGTLDFYDRHDQPALAQVVVGADVHLALEHRGWTRARPDEADVDVLVASVAQVRRQVRRRLGTVGPQPVRLADSLPDGWLVGNDKAQANLDNVRFTLDGPFLRQYAEVVLDGQQVARGRASYARDWAVVTDLMVQPEHRRQGLALVVMDALLGWAAEQGATTVSLQVISDNHRATTLYDSLGFERHHQYRYLAAPAAPSR
ncbi:GNAT family N-acetyltransferase [Nocardioides mangrovicus]|uniref:GNAT family N-acetyltransferase n=1 Tax=Nocardioides mangrovicus TaxID=2478913 RepID=A0A3L8P5X8_9ACTN|nr:GNAT family N-acetyltransferase [Nocardioides mangrovicus]